ncbi:MAG: hypothetical protein KF868_04065 [Acidobacteria bacterium]|nr:hypothetical protein [Acidobacteriota bacterium]
MNRRRKPKGRGTERGVTLIIFTIAVASLSLATALVIDVSRFYAVKAELQHAADAAAMAGASALNASASGVQSAVTRASAVSNRYNLNKQNVVIPSANVTFAVNLDDTFVDQATAQGNAPNIRFVRVTTPPAPVQVFFASMVLGNAVNITASATAGQSVPINVICGFMPVSVIDYGTPITPGNLYTFRAAPNSGGPGPGDYQILSIAGKGGRDVQFGLASGTDGCATAGQQYTLDTASGEKAGPVRKGINSRFDDYSGSQLLPSEYPPDTNIKNNITYAQYRDGTSTQAPVNPGVPDRRIVIIPIIKLSDYNTSTNTVKFDRFGVFFLRSKVPNGNGGDLVAEYISDRITVAQGDYDPNGGTGNAQLAVPVLY